MKKILCLILAAVMMLCMVSCGNSAEENDTSAAENETKVLKIGMECAYAPFNWTQSDDAEGAVKIANAEGYANGYDVQMAKKIADGIGYELEIYQYEWDALVPAVESGNLDCIIAGMSPTADRKEVIDFSSNYYVSNLVIIVNKDSDLAGAKSLADFKGCKVAAQDGTFHSDALSQIEDVQDSVMKDFTVLYTALTAGTIDGYIAEEPTAFAICAINDNVTFAPLVNNDTGFTADEGDTAIAVGMKKGSELNEAISKVIDSVSLEERAELMEKMVSLAPADE